MSVAAIAPTPRVRSRMIIKSTTGNKIDPDGINHPVQYNLHPSGVEAVEVCRYMAFNVGNAVKYVLRRQHKGTEIKDLRKAVWYLQDEIANGEALPRRFSNDTFRKWCRLLVAEPDIAVRHLFNCLYEYQEHGSTAALSTALDQAKQILGLVEAKLARPLT